jgi:hypothetical protein
MLGALSFCTTDNPVAAQESGRSLRRPVLAALLLAVSRPRRLLRHVLPEHLAISA